MGDFELIAGCFSVCGAIHEEVGDPNQDNLILDKLFFGAIDGHGPNGDIIAKHIAENLSTIVVEELLKVGEKITNENDSILQEKDKGKIQEAVSRSVEIIENEVCKDMKFENSGATLCFGFLVRNFTIALATIGDCSITIGRLNSSSGIQAISLLPPHRVSNPIEKERIEKAGGKFDSDYVVHPLFEDKVISTTRSVGDLDMKQPPFGIICTPEIDFLQITDPELDKFLIFATDGLLDFVSREEVVGKTWELIKKNLPTTNSAVSEICKQLISEIEASIDKNFQDDTTICLVYFGHKK